MSDCMTKEEMALARAIAKDVIDYIPSVEDQGGLWSHDNVLRVAKYATKRDQEAKELELKVLEITSALENSTKMVLKLLAMARDPGTKAKKLERMLAEADEALWYFNGKCPSGALLDRVGRFRDEATDRHIKRQHRIPAAAPASADDRKVMRGAMNRAEASYRDPKRPDYVSYEDLLLGEISSVLTQYLAAVRAETVEACAKVADDAKLPAHFQWGHDAMEQFNFGKKRASEAIRGMTCDDEGCPYYGTPHSHPAPKPEGER